MEEKTITREEYDKKYGKKVKKRPGDRRDGRKVRSLPPMQYVTPIVMQTRSDATNYYKDTVELSEIEKYIRNKTREEKLVGFGFMHVMVAAYIRVLTKHPALNRYIAGHKIFKRDNIVLSMMVKKGVGLNSQGTAIKPVFTPFDNAYDVYNKMTEQIAVAKQEKDSTALDNVARALFKLPTLIFKIFVDLIKLMDYIGIMPKILNTASPFHASLFISNLGSIGIQPIYHHLYNFGNIPIFITFGAMYKKYELNENGETVQKKYIDFTVVTDERITDGAYYADAMRQLARILRNPQELDTSPETILEDVD